MAISGWLADKSCCLADNSSYWQLFDGCVLWDTLVSLFPRFQIRLGD